MLSFRVGGVQTPGRVVYSWRIPAPAATGGPGTTGRGRMRGSEAERLMAAVSVWDRLALRVARSRATREGAQALLLGWRAVHQRHLRVLPGGLQGTPESPARPQNGLLATRELAP